MRIDVIPINELSDRMKKDWLKLQGSNPQLVGPCFHPQLFISVGKFCPHIHVAVFSSSEEVIGFLPFLWDQEHAAAKRIPFCDFEAIISHPDRRWDIDMIMKKIGLKSWNFDAIASYETIKYKGNKPLVRGSPRIDLSQGFEKYLASLKHGKVGDRDLMRQQRVLERTVGPVRFVPHCDDMEVLRQLVRWKVRRHNREEEWERLSLNLFEDVFLLKDPSFQGILSAVYADRQLLAVNFSIKSQGIFKGMMMTFNPEFVKYSVGKLLFYYLISEYKTFDYAIFDLGPGEYLYKQDFSNSVLLTIKGTFEVDTLKARIKSNKWLYQGLFPIVRIARKVAGVAQ